MMNRRLKLIAFASSILLSCFATVQSEDLPNIVVFISDDLGRLETSVYGSTDVRTPTMDRLAAAGMTFDCAYVASPSCCPNRFSLLTGLMPARHGAHPNHSQVKQGTPFLIPQLKKMGYYVASFGKVAHGRNKIPGCDFNSPPPREMSTNVRKFFAEHKVEQPVCLLVGDRRPHVSWTKEMDYDPNQVQLPKHFIDTPSTREHWARYLTDITGMDAEMNEILKIAKKRFDDNFIFLFTSDHGGQWPFGKWNLYDSGTRIPLIISWPEKIKSNSRSDAMVSWIDLVPTLIELAGGDPPVDIDGNSFASVLLGKSKTHREKIFTTHTGDTRMNVFPMRSVRIGKFKYVHNLTPDAWHTNHSDRHRLDGAGAYWNSWYEKAKSDPHAKKIVDRYHIRPEFELFNLENDPHEFANLAGDKECEATLAKLKTELASWTEKQGDDLQPHRDPYPHSAPIPKLERIPRPAKRASQK